MQLENPKLIKSGMNKSTGLQALSTCSACEMYCKEIKQTIPTWTNQYQEIKESGQKAENLQATHKLKKIPEC